MGTRGHITIIAEDHHYSLYQHWDMYPSGWPADLFKEAAETARDDQWDVVAHGWAAKAWVGWPDDELPQELRGSVAHPDGRQVERGGWSHGMRPRLPVEQMEAKARRRGASETLIAGLPEEVDAAPSFVEAAVMEAMEKDLTLTGGDHDREFGVVVDMDCGEIVMLKYCGPWMGERYPVPIARAALRDPEAMLGVVEWTNGENGEEFDSVEIPESIRVNEHIGTWDPYGDGGRERVSHHEDERLGFHPSVGGPERPPLRPLATYESRVETLLDSLPSLEAVQGAACAATGRYWPNACSELQDGMWRRPKGFPLLEGTPKRFLARAADGLSLPRAGVVASSPPRDGSGRCGHMGVRSGTQCVRSPHPDKHHRYS